MTDDDIIISLNRVSKSVKEESIDLQNKIFRVEEKVDRLEKLVKLALGMNE